MKEDFTVYDKVTGEPYVTGTAEVSLVEYDENIHDIVIGIRVNPNQWIDPVTRTTKQAPAPSVEVTQAQKRISMTLTPAQLFQGMWKSGFITAEEALDAATLGKMPLAVETAISTLPEEEQISARILWGRMTVIERTSPLVPLLAASVGMTEEDVDEFFETYSSV
jgi:hypothetical protein